MPAKKKTSRKHKHKKCVCKKKPAMKVVSLATALKLARRKPSKNPCNPARKSGYQPCACRDCFEIAIGRGGRALCAECRAAGCSPTGNRECQREGAYGLERANPLRHFPSLKGRGRPPKKRRFEMVTRLVNGDIYQKTFSDTIRNANARARKRMLTPHKGVKVAEVILDDGR